MVPKRIEDLRTGEKGGSFFMIHLIRYKKRNGMVSGRTRILNRRLRNVKSISESLLEALYQGFYGNILDEKEKVCGLDDLVTCKV